MSKYQEISGWIFRLLLITSIIEAVSFPQLENIYGCFTFIIVWILVKQYVFVDEKLKHCFLPTVIMFGLAFCFFFMPLIITLIEGKPLTFRFQVPYSTFSFQLLNFVMLFSAYMLCIRTYNENNLLKRIWESLGYFEPPTNKQLWCMGIIGLLSTIIMLGIQGTEDAEVENLGMTGHLLYFLRSYSSIPVLMMFPVMYGGKEKYNKTRIMLYVLFVALLGVATTRRSMMFGVFAIIVTVYLIKNFLYRDTIKISRKMAIGVVLGGYLITGPMADMAMAMILNRYKVEGETASNTFADIIDLYNDKERLHNTYLLMISDRDNYGDNNLGWSEYYVDNIFLDRFCNIRVCDATIFYAQKLGYDNSDMHKYFSNQVLFLLPTPILKFFGINVNKFELQYTPGDLMSTNALGLRTQYFGYRVAGDVGIGLYLWGMSYFFIAFFLYYALFYFMSSLVKHSPGLVIPMPILGVLWSYFIYLNNSIGIIKIISYLLRSGWQLVGIYCLFFFLIRKIVK